jgi:chromosome segregation ATPase
MTDLDDIDLSTSIGICRAIYKTFNINQMNKQKLSKDIDEISNKLKSYHDKLKKHKKLLQDNKIKKTKLNEEIEKKIKNHDSLGTIKKEIVSTDKLDEQLNSNINILNDKILSQEKLFEDMKNKIIRLDELIKIDADEYKLYCSHIKELVNEEVKKQSNNRKNRTLKTQEANKIWENLDLSLESRSQKQKRKPEARKISCKKDTDCIKPNSQRKYKCVEGFCKLSEMRATIDEKNNTIRKFTNS